MTGGVMKQAFSNDILSEELIHAETVAVVTLWSGGMTWSACAESLIRFTSEKVPICIWDDEGPSHEAIAELSRLEKKFNREVFYFRQNKNLGVVGNLNSAFATFINSDVIVLNSDIVVGPDWDQALRKVADSRTDVATVTSLSNGSGLFGIGEIPQLGKRIPTVDEFAALSEKVKQYSAHITPVVPTATSFCTLFTRKALNIVGLLDPEFSPGYGEEVDYSLRCSAYGFVHLAADSALVFHATGESFGDTTQNERKKLNDELVSRRYEYWQPFIDDYISDEDTPLARSKHLAKAALVGLKIVIDAEKVNPDLTGTFEGSSRLINALWQNPMVHSVTLVAPTHALQGLREWSKVHTNSVIDVVSLDELGNEKQYDIAFRPYQDYSGDTWPKVKRIARRNIVWHLDLIATHNPTYSLDFENFKLLDRAVTESLDQADAIGVLTKHVANDLQSTYGGKGLESKLFILQNGPTQSQALAKSNIYPDELQQLDSEPYILVLGTNYRHKNLTWLMRVFLMVRELGWVGRMVVVGPTPSIGGTVEQDYLLAESTIPSAFSFLGRVEEASKRLLLKGAKLVLVPSITEGWGLVPIEAALEGVPVISTDGGGLREVMPSDAVSLNIASDFESAERIYNLLTNSLLSEKQLQLWVNKARNLSWSDSAESLVHAGRLSLTKASWLEESTIIQQQETDNEVIQPKSRRSQSFSDFFFSISRVIFPLNSKRREYLKKVFPSVRHSRTLS